MKSNRLVTRVCQDFTRATGWPMRFRTAERTRARRSQHQPMVWQADVSTGQQRAGWLHIDQPSTKRLDSAEFLQVCELADVVAHALSNILASESLEASEELLTPTSIESPRSVSNTLDLVLEELLKLTRLRSAGFFLLNEDGSRLQLRVERHRDGQVIPCQERHLADSPIDQKALHSQLLTFRSADGMPAYWMPSNCKLGVCTAVRSSNDPIGTLWAFDRRIRRLNPREEHIIQSVARQIGRLLEHTVLQQEAVDRERMSNEFAAASGNRSTEDLNVSVGDGLFDISSRCQPFGELGGDMSEVIVQPNQTILCIADACGHDLAATIVISNARGALYSLASDPDTSYSASQFTSRMNDALLGVSQAHQFVTGIVGKLDVESRTLSYTSAGHPQLLRCRNGNVEVYDSHGLILGIVEGTPYESQSLSLEPGDVVAAYTDGFTEAASPNGRQFKVEGVANSLQRHASLSAREIRDGVWADVDKHLAGGKCDDDRTIMILKAN